MISKIALTVLLLTVQVLNNACAWEENIVGAEIAGISIIAGPLGLHKLGNMELEFKFKIPNAPGRQWPCDSKYVTTLKSTDPDRAMLGMLLSIQRNNLFYNLRITDDPTLTAYPGRCSILGVQIRNAWP